MFVSGLITKISLGFSKVFIISFLVELINKNLFFFFFEIGKFIDGKPNGFGQKFDERKHLIWEGVFKEGIEWTGKG